LLLTWLLAGCGAHRPPGRWEPALNRLCAGRVCFRVGALESPWRVAHVDGAAIGFFQPQLGAIIQATGTCRDDAEAAPLETLTRQLLIGYTERRVRSTELVPMAQREALHSVVDAKLDGVPVQLDLYVLKRNGCIFDLSYVAPPARAAAGRPDFTRFVAGFVDETPLA
jgi:hypothetical protein